jgi:uridine phosphorylase
VEKKLFSAADVPLLEFDPDKTALIEPAMMHRKQDLPEACVMIFYADVIHKLSGEEILNKAYTLASYGITIQPVDVFTARTPIGDVAVVFPGIGAPIAAAILEELIALGCRKFVACGSGGVLKPELKRGSVVIPSSAVRDEGTSYHYLPPSRTVEMNPQVVTKLENVLQKHHINYETGKTWTTDGFYRETKKKIAARKAENCLIVEMECAAFLAVAKFRDVAFGQYLSAGDDVSGDEWDSRMVSDKMTFKEKLFWLSVEASLSL